MKQIDSIPKKFTFGQFKLEKLINELGFRTVLELEIGKYFVDIYLPELEVACEYDGMGHFRKRDERRDRDIKNNYGITVIRFEKEELNKKTVEEKIYKAIGKELEDLRNGKSLCEINPSGG